MDVITGREAQYALGKAFYDSWDSGARDRLSSRFTTGSDSGRLCALSKRISSLFGEIDGSVLIIENTDVFPYSQNTFLFEIVRSHFGESRSIADAPGHIFHNEDGKIFWTILQICVINFWDFIIVSGNRNLCIRGSHNEYLDIFSLDESAFEIARNLLLSLNFKQSPRPTS